LVPRDLRYKGKNAVDTVVWRAGDTISLSLINFVRQFGVGIAGFGAIGALLIVISGSIGWTVSNRLEKQENT
jgi:AAA family ATP:ADP antiporter